MKIPNWISQLLKNATEESNSTSVENSQLKNKATYSDSENASSPRFPEPRILLLDTNPEIVSSLSDNGYNVSHASFGSPYQVNRNPNRFAATLDANLPFDYKENEIVVLDMQYDLTSLTEKPAKGNQNDTWLVSHESGLVNPRILSAEIVRSDFDRILGSGGTIIVFANKYEQQSFFHSSQADDFLQQQDQIKGSNWGFLTLTKFSNYLSVNSDFGSHVIVSEAVEKRSPIYELLSKHATNTKYRCTLQPGREIRNSWVSLLESKYGNSIGCMILPDGERTGTLFIFPDIGDKTSFVYELVDEVLPVVAPHLFPGTSTSSWKDTSLYELQSVRKLKDSIAEVRKKANRDIEELEQEIQAEHDQYSFLFDLAYETGQTLVMAVTKTLLLLGFTDIVDMDEELQKQKRARQNQEDLQILDTNPTLVVEVKGINNKPSDDDALSVQKYVVLRMREWKRVDVRGLSIICHQRHLPPLERDNEMPFRQEILDVAEEQSISLMTTWDLHRLARGFIENNWSPEVVRPLFHDTGRIRPVPRHYRYVGRIKRYAENLGVVGIEIESGELKVGDKIAFELQVSFKEQVCDSLQHKGLDVHIATRGMLVGVKTALSREFAKSGVRVFTIDK